MRASELTLERLACDGLLRRDGGRWRTTRRWQGAMARACAALQADSAEFDPRLPIVCALVALHGPEYQDDYLIEDVEALLPIEAAEHGVSSGPQEPSPEH